ncbi:dephospho-CoA kinase [Desulforudis sp. 1088]|uniref:dephospho-CoA kinase n=1 Tax=unclassified Candidatus Desulforudis TaxID=2635950 RepID=UPI003CE4538C
MTGDSGSGKTTVASMLAELGAAVIDADQVARELVKPGSPHLEAVIRAFGPAYLTTKGTLKRRRLAKLVFSDPQAYKKLDEIMLKPIINRMRRLKSEKAAEGYKVIVLDAPRLLDVGLADEVDEVWVVTADRPVKLKRLMKRGYSRVQAERILNSQMPQEQKVRQAHRVIDNNGSLTETRAQVINYWTTLESE